VLTPSTTLAYPQVVSRTFALFRVPKFGVSAGQLGFCSGFDSRQLHQKGRSDAALLVARSSVERDGQAGWSAQSDNRLPWRWSRPAGI
jgi:hypothetical protein